MTVVLFLVFLYLLYCLVRGLINPNAVLKEAVRTRERVLVLYGAGLVVCFLFIGMANKDNNEKKILLLQ